MGKNDYRGLILTNHVLERMKQRGITADQIWETFTYPDKQGEYKKQAFKREKKFGESEVTIIFNHNDKRETIVVSAWVDPPVAGSKDARQKEWWEKYKKAGFLGKLWLTLEKQVSGY